MLKLEICSDDISLKIKEIAKEIVRNNAEEKVLIGLDFFDASTENSILIASGDKTGTITDVIAETDLCDEVNYKSVFVNTQVKGAK